MHRPRQSYAVNRFLAKLRESKRHWYFTKVGEIRFRRNRHDRRTEACPLTAVYGGWDTDSPAALELSFRTRIKIIEAADRRPITPMRKRLMAACGLTNK